MTGWGVSSKLDTPLLSLTKTRVFTEVHPPRQIWKNYTLPPPSQVRLPCRSEAFFQNHLGGLAKTRHDEREFWVCSGTMCLFVWWVAKRGKKNNFNWNGARGCFCLKRVTWVFLMNWNLVFQKTCLATQSGDLSWGMDPSRELYKRYSIMLGVFSY